MLNVQGILKALQSSPLPTAITRAAIAGDWQKVADLSQRFDKQCRRYSKRTKAPRPKSTYRHACRRARRAYLEARKLGLSKREATSIAAGAGGLL